MTSVEQDETYEEYLKKRPSRVVPKQSPNQQQVGTAINTSLIKKEKGKPIRKPRALINSSRLRGAIKGKLKLIDDPFLLHTILRDLCKEKELPSSSS